MERGIASPQLSAAGQSTVYGQRPTVYGRLIHAAFASGTAGALNEAASATGAGRPFVGFRSAFRIANMKSATIGARGGCAAGATADASFCTTGVGNVVTGLLVGAGVAGASVEAGAGASARADEGASVDAGVSDDDGTAGVVEDAGCWVA